MTDKNNPSAFPTMQAASNPYGEMYMYDEGGMTLRDYFAAAALAAIPHIGCGADLNNKDIALAAYQLADAMLKARKT